MPDPLVSDGKALAYKPTFAPGRASEGMFSNNFENSPSTKKLSVALYPTAGPAAAIPCVSLQTNTEAFFGENYRFK
jgi:hypothetical protein